MTEAKHTPGPWAAQIRANDHTVAISSNCDRDGVDLGTNNNSGMFVARAQGPDMIANARLIAAAPDMLAALKMLREEDDAYGFDISEQKRDQIHDAIAKAEGRS